MTTYSENAPTFHAVQWTGDNQSAVTAALETWLQSESTDSTVDEGGNLSINFPFGGRVFQPEGWVAYGPLFGEDTSSAQVSDVMGDATFHSRFTAES